MLQTIEVEDRRLGKSVALPNMSEPLIYADKPDYADEPLL